MALIWANFPPVQSYLSGLNWIKAYNLQVYLSESEQTSPEPLVGLGYVDAGETLGHLGHDGNEERARNDEARLRFAIIPVDFVIFDSLFTRSDNMKYSGGPLFAPLVLQGLFLHGFCSSEKAKKEHSRISEEKLTKISDFYVLYMGHFSTKERNIC